MEATTVAPIVPLEPYQIQDLWARAAKARTEPERLFWELRAQRLPWTVKEVAWQKRVTVQTVRNHIRQNVLRATPSSNGIGRYRIADEDARPYVGWPPFEADAS